MSDHALVMRCRPDFEYPVVFTSGCLQPGNPALAHMLRSDRSDRAPRVMVVVDSGVAAAWPMLFCDLKKYADAHRFEIAGDPRVIAGGETAKEGLDRACGLACEMLNRRLDRQSYVLVLGGGSVLDVVGFAAAMVHRGLRLIRVPTTTLGQNDAGIGVKNGINVVGAKNALGFFAPPWGVLNDEDFLQTLDQTHWISGHAEAFKVAMIRDASFFCELCRDASLLRNRRPDAQRRAVRRCAELHLEHIASSGDPFETGATRPLDFGHWSAHQLECMSGYTLPHGHAVASGIAVDAAYACRIGCLPREDFEALLRGLSECGFTLWHEEYSRKSRDGALEIFQGLKAFQEHMGGALTLTLPQGVGAATEIHQVDRALLSQAIEDIHAASRRLNANIC